MRFVCRLVVPLLIAAAAHAQQDYPSKPIRMIVGVAPGGATDILARAVGQRLAEVFKQQVIVENRPGANHIIGGEIKAVLIRSSCRPSLKGLQSARTVLNGPA